MSPFLKQLLVVSGAAINIVGHGCAHGFPAVLFSQLAQSQDIQLTDHDVSWIASSIGIMGIIGTLTSPILMNRYGRQKTHLLTTIPALLGWAVYLLSDTVSLLILARLCHGLSLGLRTPLAAILVAEYTNPKYRGAFLGTFAVSLGLGIFFSHLLGVYLSWQMTALVCSVFPVVALIIIWLSPESPSWLASKGHFEKAEKAFIWLRGSTSEQMKELEILINSQKMNIMNYENKNRNSSSISKSVKEIAKIFVKKEFFKPALIAVNMFIVFEFGGAHIVPAYGNVILQAILQKSSPNEVYWQLSVIDFLRMLSAFFAIFLVKQFNRRTILFTSGSLTVLSLLSISLYLYFRTLLITNIPVLDTFLPMLLVVIYIVSFCLGLVPLTWVICGEVFPLAYRCLGSTFSTSCLTPAFVISLKTAPYLFSTIGVEGAFLVYAITLTCSLTVIYVLLPETKDRTLQEIEDSFVSKKVDLEVEMKLMNSG